MLYNDLGMQRLALRSEYLSPVAKNEMRAKNERKALIAKCCIPFVVPSAFSTM